MRKCTNYKLEGVRPGGRPKTTWSEVVEKECQTRQLNKEDAINHNIWTKLTSTLTIQLDDNNSLGSHTPPSSLPLTTPDDIHATTLPVYPGLVQALDCIPRGLVVLHNITHQKM